MTASIIIVSIMIFFGIFPFLLLSNSKTNYYTKKSKTSEEQETSKENALQNYERVKVLAEQDKKKKEEALQIEEYRQEIINYLKEFKLQYLNENPTQKREIDIIFSITIKVVRELTSSFLQQKVICHGQSAKLTALLFLQNTTLYKMGKKELETFFNETLEKKNVAYDLFNTVNELKLSKGYITKEEFEKDKLMAVKLSIKLPTDKLFDMLEGK